MRVRIPKKPEAFERWFYSNFAGMGLSNYSTEQIVAIYDAMRQLFDSCGLMELEFIGKVLFQLSNKSNIYVAKVADVFSQEV